MSLIGRVTLRDLYLLHSVLETRVRCYKESCEFPKIDRMGQVLWKAHKAAPESHGGEKNAAVVRKLPSLSISTKSCFVVEPAEVKKMSQGRIELGGLIDWFID